MSKYPATPSFGGPFAYELVSAYNPPVSPPAMPDAVESDRPRPTDIPGQRPSSPLGESRSENLAKKSPSQLRVQAQGALLSLAPHNIRYNELVGEGINPTVLKQLYEEVGIKVASPRPSRSSPTGRHSPNFDSSEQRASADRNLPKANPAEPTDGQVRHLQPTESKDVEMADAGSQQVSNLPNAVLPSPAPHPDGDKPLERKELIARMLAAKSGQGSGAPQSKPELEKEASATDAPPSAVAEDPATIVSLNESADSERESRAREKNKAKTELARQRMELLKRQGLTRGQHKSQSDAKGDHAVQSHPASIPTPPPIRHPLPNRPPVPDPVPPPPVRIPGLFMTEQIPPPQEATVDFDRSALVDSTPQPPAPQPPAPQPAVNQRKRPRASDFDEPPDSRTQPSMSAGSHATEDRLIIDISDDEDLYEDSDNDGMDINTSADQMMQDARSKALNGIKVPRLEKYPSSTDLSSRKPNSKTSDPSTPQPAVVSNDLEGLRQKDKEIQAMRRRIAEMEERKKTKPAPGRIEPHESLNPSRLFEAESPATANMLQENTQPEDPVRAVRHNISSEELASMKSGELENLRLKLIRRKEIESGLPTLDDEIFKFEARLAEVKEEEQGLLTEIAKGKQDRRQLVGELQHLESETSGLSLETLEAARHHADTREETRIVKEAATATPNVPNGDDMPVPDAPEIGKEELELPDSGIAKHDAKPHLSVSVEPETNREQLSLPINGAEQTGQKPSAPFVSDSGGSAMDESVDSDVPHSDDEPTLEEPTTSHPEDSRPDGLDESTPLTSGKESNSLPERIKSDTAAPVPASQSYKGDTDRSRESSVDSEAYEPPEPEATADTSEEPYTPPFSPASGPMEPLDVSAHSVDQSRADKPLAGTNQVLGSGTSRMPDAGYLDHAPQEEALNVKFSPYVSPLRFFRAYRYHPEFVKNVPGAYRSLTYSHNIDPMIYVCPFEATGGVCNDRSCDFQHFRDMTLSDDKILVQMGSLREGKTQEEKDSYLSGLKQTINDMRRDQVKDFNTVATEIAAYRRRFLQDPSRILPL